MAVPACGRFELEIAIGALLANQAAVSLGGSPTLRFARLFPPGCKEANIAMLTRNMQQIPARRTLGSGCILLSAARRAFSDTPEGEDDVGSVLSPSRNPA